LHQCGALSVDEGDSEILRRFAGGKSRETTMQNQTMKSGSRNATGQRLRRVFERDITGTFDLRQVDTRQRCHFDHLICIFNLTH
jgi:hypothetical protein